MVEGYDEGRWCKARPVNGNQSLGVTNSPPPAGLLAEPFRALRALGSGYHHVSIMASADGANEALRPIENASLGAVSACHFGGCGFNSMAATPAPGEAAWLPRRGGTTQSGEHRQPPHSRVSSALVPPLVSRSDAEAAGRNRISSSPVAARPQRFIMFGRRQGLAFRLQPLRG
jgi:hypothetical protein